MSIELHVHANQMYKYTPSNSQKHADSINGTTVVARHSSNSNIDSFDRTTKTNLSPKEQRRYENIYKRIENICKEQNIDIELAKNFGLLEKIAGVMTKAELIQLEDNKINTFVRILSDSLGWGDGLGFGEKDIDDLTKVIKDIQEKIAFEKTGGSKLGQAWHNVKISVKSAFGAKTVEKSQNENEVSSYYQEKYLKNIQNLTPKEKISTYQELLKDFYYDFNAQKSQEKQLQMIKAIENLAAQDRAVMVKIIENSFIQNPKALALFAKILDTNFESIVINRDGFNNTVGKLEATAMSHTAYRHMTEEDINSSLSRNKDRAMSFMNENSKKIDDIRRKQANGEVLTAEEENLLLHAECLESRYAGALTGTSVNYNLTESSRNTFLSRISNDTAEIGIQDAVFETVENFIRSNPDVILMPKEKFTTLMDKITDGHYSKVINSVQNASQTNKKSKNTNNINKAIETAEEEHKKYNKERSLSKPQSFDSTTNLECTKKSYKINSTNNLEQEYKKEGQLQVPEKIIAYQKEYAETLNKKSIDSSDRDNTEKSLETAVLEGVKSIKEYKETNKISNYDLTIEILSMNNTSSQITDWALDNFKTWNESQKAENCSKIKNNTNKIKAGKLIKSVAALKNVDCNNFYVKSEFEELIQKQKDKNPNSNTHLSTQQSFC